MMEPYFLIRGIFLDYLGLEDMGVYTAYGVENGSDEILEEMLVFGASLR